MILIALALAGVPAAETTPAAARAVVVRYYDAIDRGRYANAYRLWSGGGRASGKTLRSFTTGFARTARTRVQAGAPTNGDAAMGSVFITVPVQVNATLKDGTRQRFAGSYVLRRVNGVDGASDNDLRWHIMSAKLQAVR